MKRNKQSEVGLSFRVPDEIIERLDRLAGAYRPMTTRSAIARFLVEEGLPMLEKEHGLTCTNNNVPLADADKAISDVEAVRKSKKSQKR